MAITNTAEVATGRSTSFSEFDTLLVEDGVDESGSSSATIRPFGVRSGSHGVRDQKASWFARCGAPFLASIFTLFATFLFLKFYPLAEGVHGTRMYPVRLGCNETPARVVVFKNATCAPCKECDTLAPATGVPTVAPTTSAPTVAPTTSAPVTKVPTCEAGTESASSVLLIPYWWNNTKAKRKAVQAVINGNGIIINFHVTHHAGTAMYQQAVATGLRTDGLNGIYDPRRGDSPEMTENRWISPTEDGRSGKTIRNGPGLRQWASIEPGFSGRFAPETVPWDSERVVFITAWRHPITRLLSLAGTPDREFPEMNYECSTKRLDCPGDFTNFVRKGQKYNDNYALRMLADKYKGFPPLTVNDLEVAKARLRNFSLILIDEWMPETSKLLCAFLKWKDCTSRLGSKHVTKPNTLKSKSPRERIQNDSLYADLLERNRLDIELYHYARTLALEQMRAFGIDPQQALADPF